MYKVVLFCFRIKENGAIHWDELKDPAGLFQQASRRPGALEADVSGFRGNVIQRT